MYICSTCSVRRSEADEKLSPVKIQSTIIFDLVVLSQLANTCKAVIEVGRGGIKGAIARVVPCTYRFWRTACFLFPLADHRSRYTKHHTVCAIYAQGLTYRYKHSR